MSSFTLYPAHSRVGRGTLVLKILRSPSGNRNNGVYKCGMGNFKRYIKKYTTANSTHFLDLMSDIQVCESVLIIFKVHNLESSSLLKALI